LYYLALLALAGFLGRPIRWPDRFPSITAITIITARVRIFRLRFFGLAMIA
jgi:hypothetical protein